MVDGALAATRLFGQPLYHSIQAADVALRPVFLVASQLVFWGGLGFGVLSCADFAPALLSPGRIEHLLVPSGSPLGAARRHVPRRAGALALAGAVYASAGLVLVLGAKTGRVDRLAGGLGACWRRWPSGACTPECWR